MFNAYQMILCSLLSAITSSTVCSVLWLRYHRRVRSLLERDLRDLWDEIDTLEEMDEPPRQLTPEEQEVARQIKHYREHPEDYECSYEETDDCLYVTVSLKNPEEETT